MANASSGRTKWILQYPTVPSAVRAEIRRQGFDVEIVPYIQCSSSRTDLWGGQRPVICLGSLEYLSMIQQRMKWVPGPYMTLPNFQCHRYYAYLGGLLLNNEYMMMPFVEVRRMASGLLLYFGGSMFLRPSSGMKIFTGHVVGSKEDLDSLAREGVPDETLVVLSRAHDITSEYRFVVADKKVIAGSRYMLAGDISIRSYSDCVLDWAGDSPLEIHPQFAWDLAQHVAEVWQPDRLFVVDIAEAYGRFWLLEINAFSSAGWYAADLRPVIETASRIAEEDWAEDQSAR